MKRTTTPPSPVSTSRDPSFLQAVRDAYIHGPQVQASFGQQPVSPSMLFLSGGSQHGAFGGGFVHEWAAERPSGLPRFKVVTGISTGAIYATHAFLNRTDVIVRNERIFHERELLNRYVGKGGMKTLGGGITTVRRGAVGDLFPMRNRYLGELTNDVMMDVAREADAGRKLYIGAVDIDLGKAAVFDMTDYARAYRDNVPATDTARREHMRLCYSNVILASSSVPVAAPPTVIDNRMYIDGGARFGLLTDELGKTADEIGNWLDKQELPAGFRPQRPNIYLLINGTLETDVRCGKLKKSKGDNPCPKDVPKTSPVGQHENWDILGVVERSVGILINQIYRFSNDRIWLAASQRGFVPHMQRMLPDINEVSRKIGFPGEDREMNCDAWAGVDDDLDHPLEFHPRYMHCLVEYGRERAQKSKWACFDPLPATVPAADRVKWTAMCRNVPQDFREARWSKLVL